MNFKNAMSFKAKIKQIKRETKINIAELDLAIV